MRNSREYFAEYYRHNAERMKKQADDYYYAHRDEILKKRKIKSVALRRIINAVLKEVENVRAD